MLPSLIKIFNLVAIAPDSKLLDAVEVNKYAMRYGYFVHPHACTNDVIDFLKSQKANFNSTFHKDWQNVARRSEIEMRILQMIHYISTYGTDYQGNTFTLNDTPTEMQFSKYTMIMPCTDRILFDRIAGLLATPTALSNELLKQAIEQLRQYNSKYGWTVDVDSIANREALIRLCDIFMTLPKKAEDLMRLIVYKATGQSLIIKNKTTYDNLTAKSVETLPIFGKLTQIQTEGLASIFYRYKTIFLALRQGFKTLGTEEGRRAAATINRLRRMAPKFHRPAQIGVLESILDHRHSILDVREAIEREKSNFKLVRIINYLDSINPDNLLRAYLIRNGKIFVAPNRHRFGERTERVNEFMKMVIDELSCRLKAKAFTPDGRALTVLFPENVELAAPVSERQFVGNIPFGTAYTLRKNNLIGIYWRNEWGARDFDLWLTACNGQRLGWNANHKDGDLLFSGDMTNADPEASEIFYGKGETWPDCIISIARYNGERSSKFRLFFASDDIKELPEGYMVRPDSVLFHEDIISDTTQTTIGAVKDHRLYFGSIGTGNQRVPQTYAELKTEEAIASRLSSSITLRALLLSAGFIEYDKTSSTPPDIDLTDLRKDTLLELFK